MIASTLALIAVALPPQVPTGPARLHPPETVFYSETPDVADVLIAYEDAPIARMINDTEVRQATADLMDSLEFDLQAMLARRAAQLGIPPAIVASPIKALTAYLNGVDSLSASLSFHEDQAGEFEQTITRMLRSLHEIDLLQADLAAYAEANEGRYPTDLASLEPAEDLLTDEWGRDYEYRPHSDGASYELRTAGADGVFGGRGANADLESSAGLESALADELLRRIGALLVLEFSSGATANQTHMALQAALTRAPLSPVPTSGSESPAQGVLSVYEPSMLRGSRGWTLLHESRLVVGFGTATPAEYFERLDGRTPSVAGSPEYAALSERLPLGDGASITRGFVSAGRLIGSGKEIAEALGVDWNPAVDPATLSLWSVELAGDRFVTDYYHEFSGEESALARCVAFEPLSQNLQTFVPADAVIVAATTIDTAVLYQQLMNALGTESWQGQVPSALTTLEERYGFHLETDVFGSIGSDALFYMLPVSGLMSVPGMAVILELDDPESFQRGLEGLLALLAEQGQGEFVIKYRPYRDHPMWYFVFSHSGGSPIQISPSLVIFEDHLIVTLTSLRGKKEIKRLSQERGELHPLFTGTLPEGVTAAGYVDVSSLANGVYEGGRALLSLMGGGLDLPFDVAALPDPETFTRFYEPMTAWSRREGNGTHSRVSSSHGPEALGSVAGVALVGMAVAQGAIRLTEDEPATASVRASGGEEQVVTETLLETVGIEAPAPQPETPPTDETLRLLSNRLAIYKLEQARYPDDLGDLLKATENYPRGFLSSQELPTDEWGRAFSYTVSEDGKKFQLWSLGPDGIDQQRGGDDVAAS